VKSPRHGAEGAGQVAGGMTRVVSESRPASTRTAWFRRATAHTKAGGVRVRGPAPSDDVLGKADARRGSISQVQPSWRDCERRDRSHRGQTAGSAPPTTSSRSRATPVRPQGTVWCPVLHGGHLFPDTYPTRCREGPAQPPRGGMQVRWAAFQRSGQQAQAHRLQCRCRH